MRTGLSSADLPGVNLANTETIGAKVNKVNLSEIQLSL
jgi:uncharacterized protein YjbI with pentapeptide repeats